MSELQSNLDADGLIRKYVSSLLSNDPDTAAEATKGMVNYAFQVGAQAQASIAQPAASQLSEFDRYWAVCGFVPDGANPDHIYAAMKSAWDQAKLSLPAKTEYRACCQHTDCTICRGNGGYIRLLEPCNAASIAQPDSTGRSDQQIVDQTERLAKALAEYDGWQSTMPFKDAINPRAQGYWNRACLAQEILTATDVTDAVDSLDGEPAHEQPAAPSQPANNLLSRVRNLAELGMSHGLLADDYCTQIVSAIDDNASLPLTSLRDQALDEAALACDELAKGDITYLEERGYDRSAETIRALKSQPPVISLQPLPEGLSPVYKWLERAANSGVAEVELAARIMQDYYQGADIPVSQPVPEPVTFTQQIALDERQRLIERVSTLEHQLSQAAACRTCNGTGIDGDCGSDGAAINVMCGCCKGTGRPVSQPVPEPVTPPVGEIVEKHIGYCSIGEAVLYKPLPFGTKLYTSPIPPELLPQIMEALGFANNFMKFIANNTSITVPKETGEEINCNTSLIEALKQLGGV